MQTRLILPLGLAGAALLLAGCSTSVSAADVEANLEGKIPDASVSCPEDLEGKVGTTLTCDASIGDFETKVEVKVTAVGGKNGSNVIYTYTLADEPPTE